MNSFTSNFKNLSKILFFFNQSLLKIIEKFEFVKKSCDWWTVTDEP